MINNMGREFEDNSVNGTKEELTSEEAVKWAVEEARRKAEEAAAEQAADSAGDSQEAEPAEAGTEQETQEAAQEDAEGAAEEEEGGEEASGEAEEPEKKGFFGKKKKEKKDKKDIQIEELKDRVMRQMAEFDNFRKRTEREKAGMYEVGVKSVIEKLLPVVDNFERGLASVPEEQKQEGFVQGMEMIYKQLMEMLDGMEVKAIDAVGKEFDPNLHNAVMHVDDDSVGEGIVVEEFQKGYLYRDSVVRHSMVKVAN